MPKIVNKISVYGDSGSYGALYSHWPGHPEAGFAQITGRMNPTPVQRIASYTVGGVAKFAGSNDYTMGGNTLAQALSGIHATAGSLYGSNRNFATHISTYDNCDIVLIRLGTNDVPDQWAYNNGDPRYSRYVQINSSYQAVIENIKTMVNLSVAAGKRVVIAGNLFLNIENFVSWNGYPSTWDLGLAVGLQWGRIKVTNEILRSAAYFLNVPFIDAARMGNVSVNLGDGTTLGSGDVPDGLHPAQTYSYRVADYLASQVVAKLGM